MKRHEKWVKVEPGTMIPAGQPYRIEPHRRGRRRHEVEWDAKELKGRDHDWELGASEAIREILADQA